MLVLKSVCLLTFSTFCKVKKFDENEEEFVTYILENEALLYNPTKLFIYLSQLKNSFCAFAFIYNLSALFMRLLASSNLVSSELIYLGVNL